MLALAVATLGVLGVVPAGAAAAAASPVTVQANNFRFCAGDAPACTPTDTGFAVTVQAGAQVTWLYKDTECDAVVPCPGHNVTFADAAGKTIKQDGATLFTRVFDTPGRYDYRCTIHEGFGMTGVVVVQGQATSPGLGGGGDAGGASPAGGSPTAELPTTGDGRSVPLGLLGVGLAAVGVVLLAGTRREWN